MLWLFMNVSEGPLSKPYSVIHSLIETELCYIGFPVSLWNEYHISGVEPVTCGDQTPSMKGCGNSNRTEWNALSCYKRQAHLLCLQFLDIYVTMNKSSRLKLGLCACRIVMRHIRFNLTGLISANNYSA